MDSETLCSFLISVQTQAGLAAAVAFIMSFFLEWEKISAWFQALDKKAKRLIVMGFSLIIGLGTYGISVLMLCQAYNPQQLWTVFVNAMVAYTASQVAHLISDK